MVTLNKKQVAALKKVLDYVSYDECEDCAGDASPNHIWASIRVVYAAIFGKKELEILENEFKEERYA